MDMSIDPKDVSEDLLDRSGRALMSGDFDEFWPCFELPQEVDTFEGRKRIETREEMRAVFDGVCAHLRRKGVTELLRICISARFDGPDMVRATHQSRLLSGGVLVQAPYTAYSILRRTEGQWRVAFSQYAINDAPEHNAALLNRSAPGQETLR